MKKTKEMKGITLIALVITIIILLILAGISVSALTSNNRLFSRAKEAKEKTEIASIKEQIQTDIMGEQAGNTGNISDSSLKTILEKYGTINYETDGTTIKSITTTKGGYEIAIADIWSGTTNNSGGQTAIADGSWNGEVNTPKIENIGLTAVYWNGTEWIKLSSTSSQDEWNKWYDYKNKKWANAQSTDGSMWVWIPRYEYKIDSTAKTISVNFVKIGNGASSGYTLHPAFGTDIDNGGWKSDLPGFWVAKYPAGYQNATVGETTKTVENSSLKYTELNEYTSNFLNASLTTSTNLSYPVFKANTYAYNIISVGDAWLLSQEIDKASMYGLSNVDSHLQKNSEWGAVAYLTHSQYGVNGNSTTMNEVTMNTKNLSNSIYVNNDSSTNVKANVYAVTSYGSSDKANDVTASSTKNMTGVFDLNGCVWERVAGYYKGGATSTPEWHNAMASLSTTNSSEYLTLYTVDYKKGDATKETSGWNEDYSNFITSSIPVFNRGGNCVDVAYAAGVFAFSYSNGSPFCYNGFRVCLAF